MISRLKITALLMAATAISTPMSVAAQSGDDVVVMRRVVAPPKRSVAPDPRDPANFVPVPGADLTGTYWVVSGWFAEQDACTATSEQTRLRGCVYRGVQVPDENCPSPAPELTQIVEDYNGCTYEWESSVAGPWADACSMRTSRPLNAVCMRKDGTPSSDEFCAGQRKPTFENGSNLEGCTYEWLVGDFGDWESRCSTDTVRRRTVQCRRSDGGIAQASFCPAPIPASSERGENTVGCQFYWEPREWGSPTPACAVEATRFRTLRCMNSNRVEVPESFCEDIEKPATSEVVENLGQCQYEWKTSEFTEWSSTCSDNATRTRLITCEREDGTEVETSFCSGQMPDFAEEATITTGCTYDWAVGEWKTLNTCSENTTRSRPVFCARSDGKNVDSNFCPNASRPVDSEPISDVSGCTYEWETSDWSPYTSTCSAAVTRTRTATCKRGDGQTVDNSFCDPRDLPVLQTVDEVYTGCQRQWVAGEWSEFSSQCSSASRRDRLVECMQLRPGGPVSIRVAECADIPDRPAQTEIVGIYTACTNAWEYGSWGWEGVVNAASSTCSLNALQTRTAECKATVEGGLKVTVPDANCTEPKQETTKTVERVNGCSYTWSIGNWTPWSSTCSATATRSRTVTCLRLDEANTPVEDNLCVANGAGAIPERVQNGPNVTDCSGLLRNGGFEQSTLGAAQDWTVPVGTIFTTIQRFEGTKSMLLAPNSSNLPATQIIGTIPGVTYQMSLHFRSDSNFGITARANGSPILSVATLPTGGSNTWLQATGTFVATGTSTTIAINRAQSNSYNLFVDNILLTPRQ